MVTNEAARLHALQEYRILDTEAERSYDDITALATHICDVPIAVISLVDHSRQWFKPPIGLSLQETLLLLPRIVGAVTGTRGHHPHALRGPESCH